MMIVYREFGCELLSEVYAMYQAEGWNLYTDMMKVKRAWEKSLYIFGAFDHEKLVGFIRCLGDGEYDLYVSDLLVSPEYRRKGIGKTLLKHTMEQFEHVDTFALMTGMEEEHNQAFYRAAGMNPYSHNGLIGFLR